MGVGLRSSGIILLLLHWLRCIGHKLTCYVQLCCYILVFTPFLLKFIKNNYIIEKAQTDKFLATVVIKLIISRVIFLFHRVIKEEYCIKIIPSRTNTCQNNPFYQKIDTINLCQVPVQYVDRSVHIAKPDMIKYLTKAIHEKCV